MNNFHIGDRVTQVGDHNIGIVKTVESQVMITELSRAVSVLRDHVGEQEKERLDESVEDVKDPTTNARIIRRALDTIAKIATRARVASTVVVPVLDVVEKLRALFSS